LRGKRNQRLFQHCAQSKPHITNDPLQFRDRLFNRVGMNFRLGPVTCRRGCRPTGWTAVEAGEEGGVSIGFLTVSNAPLSGFERYCFVRFLYRICQNWFGSIVKFENIQIADGLALLILPPHRP